MLTETETKRLMQPGEPRDKMNDFIVRKKLAKWLDGLYVVFVIIFRYLPEKQLKKLITREHFRYLIDILLHLFSISTVPMIKNGDEYIAVDRYRAPRPATQEEIYLNGYIKSMIHALFHHLSPEDAIAVMDEELARNHPEHMIRAKRST